MPTDSLRGSADDFTGQPTCATFHYAITIALAEALGCELLTGDAKLENAAGHHVTVIVTR